MRGLMLSVMLSGCLAQPLLGPGFEEGSNVQGPFVAVITHTRIAKGERERFGEHIVAVEAQQDQHEGFLGRAFRTRLTSRTRWTLTVWQDEESMLRFATEGAHLEAMLDSAVVIDGVRSAVWTVQDEDYPPSWPDAMDRLEQQSPDVPWR